MGVVYFRKHLQELMNFPLMVCLHNCIAGINENSRMGVSAGQGEQWVFVPGGVGSSGTAPAPSVLPGPRGGPWCRETLQGTEFVSLKIKLAITTAKVLSFLEHQMLFVLTVADYYIIPFVFWLSVVTQGQLLSVPRIWWGWVFPIKCLTQCAKCL